MILSEYLVYNKNIKMKASDKKVAVSKEYSAQLKNTLEGLVSYLIDKKPEDPVSNQQTLLTFLQIPYMLQFLEEKKGVAKEPLSMEERTELNKLRQQHEAIKRKMAGSEERKKPADSDSDNSGHNSSDSEVRTIQQFANQYGYRERI